MKYIFILVHLSIAFVSPGQSIDLNQGNFISSEYFIELPYKKINDKLIVEVELGGKKRKFIVDTGAPLVLSKALFEELNCTVLAKQEVDDINQQKDSLLFVSVESLKIGNELVTGIPAIVLPENLIMECLKVDGFIGSNVFRNSVVQFDDRNAILSIADTISKLKPDLKNGTELMLDQQSSPYLKLNIGKKISEFVLFDSGSDELYSMAHMKIEKFIKAKDFEVLHESYGSNTLGMTGVADNQKTSLLFIPFVLLSGVKIDMVIAETNTDVNSRIGAKILRHGKMTLDYNNKKYYFERFQEQQEFKNSHLQINPVYSENGFCIGKIWTKELEQKVKVGDKIVGIDGKNVEAMTICEAITNPLLKGNSNYKIDVRTSKGEIVSLEIEMVKGK